MTRFTPTGTMRTDIRAGERAVFTLKALPTPGDGDTGTGSGAGG